MDEIQNDEISLKELIYKGKEWTGYLLTQWWKIAIAGLIGALLGFGYAYIKKPVYTAALSYAIEDGKDAGGGLGSLASSFGLNLGGGTGGAFSGNNLMELFKSRSMVEKTLLSPVTVNGKEISLAELYIQDKNWRTKWNDNPNLTNIHFLPNADREKFSRVQDSIMGIIYKDISKNNLTIDQKDKKLAITLIEMKATDEYFAQQFTLALTKTVTDFYVDTKSKKAKENMAILNHQIDSIRGQLNGAITSVAVANDNTFALNPALNVKRVPSARRQVDVQANTAILTEIVKQAELAKVTLRKETPLIQIIDEPILPLPKEEFGKIKGIILGFIMAGFVMILFLILGKIIRELT